ncbi:MAG: hypothetical protein K8R41_07960 [Bacteroidales bacterium]|nr:hypothetical protein [Bacteroidales bacterium]
MRKRDNTPSKTLIERYKLIRHPERIRSSDVIKGVFEKISYYESPDPSLIVARGTIDKIRCIIIGQEKRRQGKESKATGMVTAEGHGFILDILDEAEEHNTPVISFIDTFGGNSSMEAEMGGQSFLISDCISRFCNVKTPTLSYVIGEGGSGGALAIQIADKGFMLENALYSVIAPESCSRIIFHKRLAAGEEIEATLPDALEVLRPGAEHIRDIGMIDEILPEPKIGAHINYEYTIKTLKNSISKELDEWVTSYKSGKKVVKKKVVAKLLKERREKVLNYGEFYNKLGKLVKRMINKKPPVFKDRVDIESEDFYNQLLIKAHLEEKGIEETELFECIKEWDPKQNLFRVAGGCGFVSYKDYVDNFYACPKCGKGEYLSIEDQIEKICDKDTYIEIENDLNIYQLFGCDRYNFGKYKSLLEKMQKKCFSNESLVTGTAKINGKNVVLVLTDIQFIGGSFGAVFGEKFKRAVDFAIKHKYPFISVCSSGGARMNEGPMALAQMAKMNMSLLDLKKEGILYISVIAGPTTGGAYASYVTQGDIIIGEEGGLVEFAGPRVVTGAGFEVDRDIVITDKLYETKKIHEITKRKDLKDALTYYVNFFYCLKFPKTRKKLGRIRDFRK